MIAMNRLESEIDKGKQQNFVLENDFQMRLDVYQDSINSNPNKPEWSIHKYKEASKQNESKLRKKRLEHLEKYNTKVLKI